MAAVGETTVKPRRPPVYTVSTLNRGLRVLEAIADPGVAQRPTLSELSMTLGMHRSTVFRFLVTLQERGYVSRDPGTDRYELGVSVLTLAQSLLNDLDIRQIAHPVLLALRDATQELVHLALLDHGEVVTVERCAGTQALSLQTDIGARRPAYCTASGKAILAHLPPDDVAGLLDQGMPAITTNTVTSPAVMQEHLSEVRRLGYASDNEERTEGVRCVAAPVFGREGNVLGAVSIAVPTLRLPSKRVHALGREVRTAAETISQRLGYTRN